MVSSARGVRIPEITPSHTSGGLFTASVKCCVTPTLEAVMVSKELSQRVIEAMDGRPFGKEEKQAVQLCNAAPELLGMLRDLVSILEFHGEAEKKVLDRAQALLASHSEAADELHPIVHELLVAFTPGGTPTLLASHSDAADEAADELRPVFEVEAEVVAAGGGSDGQYALCGRFTAKELSDSLLEVLGTRVKDQLLRGGHDPVGSVLKINIRDR
jgi:hypothetical protein